MCVLFMCTCVIYVDGINSKEEDEEEIVDAVMMREKRPTWDANYVRRA